ncbi:helix-turn-helix transcriptional regulator [Roseivivax sediminis]|uniref:Helix-turn-helix domain-containing protein n=1 Tax=Roseivivax sediminis TaxID=936889 RepID=A0A1I1S957_9RHOB|nr:helix-turn-helix domain-containing protein [Roseivivax sediminis]SFD42882.1 hypothetical protein SAMN04515678_10135 [Roseivivax sediminis]
MSELPPYLTTRELAERWRVTCRTLERWRAEPYGPGWVTIGGAIRYRREDVLAWEAAHLTQP